MTEEPTAISLPEAFLKLTFLPNRAPDMPGEQSAGAFAELAPCRDGGVFIAHYAGNSEWERHPAGDEVVYVVEGATTLFLQQEGRQVPHRLVTGGLFVVPRNTWHRFETPDGVKVMTVTPQPTDHSVDAPDPTAER